MDHAGRGRRAKPRRRGSPRTAAVVAAVAVAGLAILLGAGFVGHSMANDEQLTARQFTGEVASFADDGRMVCVEPDDADVPTPFCDVYFVSPDSDRVQIGDRVRVRTLTSRDADGTQVAGILLTPVAAD